MPNTDNTGRPRRVGRLGARLVIVVASTDPAEPERIKGMLRDEGCMVLEGFGPKPLRRSAESPRRCAFLLNVTPTPQQAKRSIASIRAVDSEVPILFAVDQNSEQLEINVRSLGVQYYMLLPARREELLVVVNSLARA